MRIVILSHPARAALWPRLHAAFPGALLHVDEARAGVVEASCSALEWAAEGAGEWVVYLQDDIDPLPDLAAAFPGIIAGAPPDAAALSGFSIRWKADREALEAGVRWRIRRHRELLWVHLLALRAERISEAVASIRAQTREAPSHLRRSQFDERLSRWLDRTGLPAYTHIPSLVQHIGEVSLLGHSWRMGGRPRVSTTWPGIGVSAWRFARCSAP